MKGERSTVWAGARAVREGSGGLSGPRRDPLQLRYLEGQIVFLMTLTCTTRRRIPTSAMTNQEAEKDDLTLV